MKDASGIRKLLNGHERNIGETNKLWKHKGRAGRRDSFAWMTGMDTVIHRTSFWRMSQTQRRTEPRTLGRPDSWWKRTVSSTVVEMDDFVKHIFGDHNQEADHLLNLGADAESLPYEEPNLENLMLGVLACDAASAHFLLDFLTVGNVGVASVNR